MLNGWREGLYGLGQATLNLLGSASTVVGGFAATPTGPASLTINIAAGDIFETAAVDATTYGSLAADARQTMQVGHAEAGTQTLTTAGLSSGQSRWALVQATFSQTDEIPSDDPNGGLLAYLDTTNPAGPPWSGPGNTGVTQPTRRKAVATVSVIYGVVAATGTEVPPNPSANNVPLYLIDLAFGQTTISAGQILVAGPSVGVNVPNNYPQAPFLAGLLNSHHSGGAGQAPKIKLTSEVQGILPSSNMDVPFLQLQASNYAVATGTANAQVVALNPPVTARKTGLTFRFKPVAANSGAVTIDYGGGAVAMSMPFGTSQPSLNLAVLNPGFVYTAVDDGTKIVVLECDAMSFIGVQTPPPVTVPNTGTSTQICPQVPSGGGFAMVTGDDGASNTFCDIVPWYQFSNTGLNAVQNPGGTPGTRSYISPNVTGGLNMTRTGGPANMLVNIRVFSR